MTRFPGHPERDQRLTGGKKHSAGLTAKTERGLAAKVGHLELLAGGKRGSKTKGKGKGQPGEKKGGGK